YARFNLTGFINKIDSPSGALANDEVTVRIAIITGFLRTMDSTPVDPKFAETPIAYQDGYYHQATKVRLQDNKRHELLFCFNFETPNWIDTGEFAPTQPIPT